MTTTDAAGVAADSVVIAAAGSTFCAVSVGRAVSAAAVATVSVAVLLGAATFAAVAFAVAAVVAGFDFLVGSAAVAGSAVLMGAAVVAGSAVLVGSAVLAGSAGTVGVAGVAVSGALPVPEVPVVLWALTTTPSPTSFEVLLDGLSSAVDDVVLATSCSVLPAVDGVAVGLVAVLTSPADVAAEPDVAEELDVAAEFVAPDSLLEEVEPAELALLELPEVWSAAATP